MSGVLSRHVSFVTEGLALGCARLGVLGIPAGDQTPRSAIDRAWNRWPYRHRLTVLHRSGDDVGQLVWTRMTASYRPRPEPVAWWHLSNNGQLIPTVYDSGVPDLLARIPAIPTSGWEALAAGFITRLDEPATATPGSPAARLGITGPQNDQWSGAQQVS